MIFNSLIRRKGLPYKAASAGAQAIKGGCINPYSVTALNTMGFSVRKGFHSRFLSEKLISNAEKVVCLKDDVACHINDHGLNKGAVTIIDHPIPDPYGYGIEVYIDTVRALRLFCEGLIEQLKYENNKEKGER